MNKTLLPFCHPHPWLDTDRLPNLSERAAHRLKRFVQHRDAPRFTGRSGHRLTATDVHQLNLDKVAYQEDRPWVTAFLDRCRRQVPHYREYPWHQPVSTFPCTSRKDLSSNLTAFVPDDIDINRLIAYETSGTTGHPLTIPSQPLVAARYHCFHERILSWHGIELQSLPGDTGVMLVGDQQRCFTYASALPYWDDKLLLKINLNPGDWPNPEARGRYIDACKPILLTGDPRSLSTLLSIDFQHQPTAIMSTSMTLLQGIKDRLIHRFNCPVINLYSMNEAGPIAADDGNEFGLRLVQSTLLVEILDREGHPVPSGERGEITLTGGFNPCLPLLRYRTGDYARMSEDDLGHRYLQHLDGRPPVRYQTVQGWLNNVDITHLLQPFELAHYQFHQDQHGNLTICLEDEIDCTALSQVVAKTFGSEITITIKPLPRTNAKLIQYTSDYPGAQDV